MPHLLQEFLSVQADRKHDTAAVVSSDQSLSYGELEALSNRIARALKDAGCRRGERVCLLMPKSPMAIAAWLGIYKADCIYVPLDPANPAGRLSRIILNCECRCIITSIAAVSKLEEIFENESIRLSTVVGWLDTRHSSRNLSDLEFSLNDILTCSPEPLVYKSASDDPAHILFTSGSTGMPKGMVITHSNVIGFIEWAVDYFRITGDDRLSGHPPLHFDLSVFDVFATFAAGAELHLVPTQNNLLPHKLAQWIRDSRLTQWFSVPSLLNYLCKFNVIRENDFPSLRRLLWCGEVFPTPALKCWMERLPHVQFTNLYGPTETTIASSYYTVPECPDDDKQPVPIGTACPGEELLILDDDLQPVLQGDEGELYIRGSGLGQGYWQDPVKTAEVFLQIPGPNNENIFIYKTGDRAVQDKDGLVYYLGRKDDQIKSRGYRIEPGEIEAALRMLPQIRESVVVAYPTDGFENMEICCAYSVTNEDNVTQVAIRNHLATQLPDYMIPSHWLRLDTVPRNSNGKLDRSSVRERFEKYASVAN